MHERLLISEIKGMNRLNFSLGFRLALLAGGEGTKTNMEVLLASHVLLGNRVGIGRPILFTIAMIVTLVLLQNGLGKHLALHAEVANINPVTLSLSKF